MRIVRVMIERFRGLKLLVWDPSPGLNCIVGPADSGKSTLLAAIELLLAPWQPALFEFDYWQRRVADGFQISAVLADLPEDFVSSFRVPPLHGWSNGELRELPEPGTEPVMVAVFRGLADLEPEHILVDPSGQDVRFPVSQRMRLRATRLNWDRADIELRLSRGSLLQQHLGGQGMRSALTGTLAEASERLELPPDVATRLKELGAHYAQSGLPGDLQLGLQSPRRESLLGLLGLLQGKSHADAVPLSLAGVGTRRLAAFELAAALGVGSQLVLVDEPEVGLEPYRQRRLVARLRELIGDRGQAILTTHSSAVLATLSASELARLTPHKCPVRFAKDDLDRLMKEDPEALLARVPVLCEGPTETGVLRELLPHVGALAGPAHLDALGIRLVSRSGQPSILKESRALAEAGVHHGLFVDNERVGSGTREALAKHPYVEPCTWSGVCNVEEAVAEWLPKEQLESLFELAAELNQRSIESLRQALGARAELPGKLSFAEVQAKLGESQARKALAKTMNECAWFKSEEKGAGLGRFLIQKGLPAEIREVIENFWTRVKPWVAS